MCNVIAVTTIDLKMHIKHFEMQSDTFQTSTLNLVLLLHCEISMYKYKNCIRFRVNAYLLPILAVAAKLLYCEIYNSKNR